MIIFDHGLPYAPAEASHAFPGIKACSTYDAADVGARQLLDLLAASTHAHLALHAAQNPKDPLRNAMFLGNHEQLTARQIADGPDLSSRARCCSRLPIGRFGSGRACRGGPLAFQWRFARAGRSAFWPRSGACPMPLHRFC